MATSGQWVATILHLYRHLTKLFSLYYLMKCFSLCCSKKKKRKKLVHIQWWYMPNNLANIFWITLYNELKRLVSLSPFYTLGNGKLREREIAANTWHLSLSPVVSKTEKSKHTFSFLPCPLHFILRITPNTWFDFVPEDLSIFQDFYYFILFSYWIYFYSPCLTLIHFFGFIFQH